MRKRVGQWVAAGGLLATAGCIQGPDYERPAVAVPEEFRFQDATAAFEADRPLSFHSWEPGAEMATDRHGIPIPADGEDVVPDVVLVPLNAFDARGFRLGYGGGYFDRTLETLVATAIGVGFELGRAATVFPQDHDRPMDWIVTEEGAHAAVRD